MSNRIGKGSADLRKLGLYNEQEKTKWIVLTVVSMTLITIILAMILKMWADSFIRSDKQTPKLETECFVSLRGDYIVMIEKVDPDAVGVINCNYILLDEHGRAVPGVQGSVREIYGVDLDFRAGDSDDQGTFNVSFVDMDKDGKICADDYFIIRSEKNGGIAEMDYSLLIKFDVTGEKMNTPKNFTNSAQKYFDYPTSRLDATLIDSGNISIVRWSRILERFQIQNGQEVEIYLPISYLGEGEGNITIRMFNQGYLTYERIFHPGEGEQVNVSDHFVSSMMNPVESFEMQNVTFIIHDNERNRTLFSGYCDFYITGWSTTSPSFSISIELMVMTIGCICVLNWIDSRQSGKVKI